MNILSRFREWRNAVQVARDLKGRHAAAEARAGYWLGEYLKLKELLRHSREQALEIMRVADMRAAEAARAEEIEYGFLPLSDIETVEVETRMVDLPLTDVA